ncbi:MAG: sulfite exporter TauE/SafE family protein [Myxococcota bacterium]
MPGGLDLAAAAAAVFAGALLQGAVGFGYALVAAPILFMIDGRLVPGPVLLGALMLTALCARRDWTAIDFEGFGWGLMGRVPGTLLGAAAVSVIPADRFAAPLGALVLIAVAMTGSGVRIDPNPRTLAGAGLLAGFMGTTSSIGGPPLAMVYQHAPGDRLRGTLSVYFVVGCLMSLSALAVVGRLGTYELTWGAALLPGVVLGFALSKRLTPWVDRGYTRPAVLAVSAAAGIGVVARALW